MLETLTNRQIDICMEFINSKGINPIEFIAKKLNIQECTVRTHLSDIYTKLLINSRLELMYLLAKNYKELAQLGNRKLY